MMPQYSYDAADDVVELFCKLLPQRFPLQLHWFAAVCVQQGLPFGMPVGNGMLLLTMFTPCRSLCRS